MSADGPIVQIANAVVLAGAGAFTDLPDANVIDVAFASVWVTYTQGAAGGTPTIRIRWSASGLGNTPTQPGNTTGTVITGGLSLAAEEWVLSNPGSSPYSRVLPLNVPAAARTLVVGVAESGVVGSPGTVSVWVGTRL